MTLSSPIITVFGATGMIGQALIAQLARTSFDGRKPLIRAVTRATAKAESLRLVGEVGQITPIFCNPADTARIASAVAGSSAVINCIGLLTESRRAKFAAVQGELPGLIAQAMLKVAPQDNRQARLIHLSAIGADANSASAYARSKAAGEGVLRALYPSATILRPSVVFGPNDQFFNRFAKLALLSPVLPLFGNPNARLQPVFVEDVAAAIINVLRHHETAGRIYELGGSATYTMRELLLLLLRTIRRVRYLLNVPGALAVPLARLLELLPGKALTRDQLHLLARDNIANPTVPGLPQLGIVPTALEAILPTYLGRFRPQGQFNTSK